MRELERSVHVANREHWCDCCCTYISPGQMYERFVYLDKHSGRVVVFKTHINPSCDPPEDPVDEDAKEEKKVFPITKRKESEFKRAA